MFHILQEQGASTWQSKYKKAIVDLEEAEERSEAAEQALQKARQRARGASAAPTRGVSPKFILNISLFFLCKTRAHLALKITVC